MAEKKAFVNEQTIEISAGGITGVITVPRSITPEQLDVWWKTLSLQEEQEKAGSDILPVSSIYQRRQHLITGLDHPMVDENGRPYPELAWAIIAATDDLVKAATQRPTSPALSANGASLKAD